MLKKLAMAAIGLIALSASSANAQQRWPSWYIGLHANMAFIPEQDVEVNGTNVGDVDFDQGYGAGASIGYMPGGALTNFRFELEYTFISSDIDAVPGFSTDEGELRSNAFMFNALYDIPMGGFVPYLGAGAGIAGLTLDADSPNESDSDEVFAWQLMAGIGWAPELAPNTTLSLGYKYFNADSANFSLTPLASVESDYEQHNIELGARFAF